MNGTGASHGGIGEAIKILLVFYLNRSEGVLTSPRDRLLDDLKLCDGEEEE